MSYRASSKKEDYLKPGDLIEIFRVGYEHWAIYVGDGYVIHVAPTVDIAGASSASLSSTENKKALVKKERLVDVVGSDRWRVNNKYDSKYEPLPISKIISRAEAKVGQEVEYKVTSKNCEHFVTELRYGVARSDQVQDKMVGIAGTAGVLGILGTIAVAGLSAMRN